MEISQYVFHFSVVLDSMAVPMATLSLKFNFETQDFLSTLSLTLDVTLPTIVLWKYTTAFSANLDVISLLPSQHSRMSSSNSSNNDEVYKMYPHQSLAALLEPPNTY